MKLKDLIKKTDCDVAIQGCKEAKKADSKDLEELGYRFEVGV